MTLSQFGEGCYSRLFATKKISIPNVTALDFMRYAVTANIINALDKRARNVTINDVTTPLDEFPIPACLKSMIYPSAMTANGDINNEADILSHSFDGLIDMEEKYIREITYTDDQGKEVKKTKEDEIKPFDEYEMADFISKLYGTWKCFNSDVVYAGDLRSVKPFSSANIELTSCKGVVHGMINRNFPISVKYQLFSDEVPTEVADTALKKWYTDALSEKSSTGSKPKETKEPKA